jgi:choline dehydrogenase
VLASRLSEDPGVRVLLLEAGPAEGPDTMLTAGTWPFLQRSAVDWAFASVPQRGLGGRSVPYPRGKVLGGTSAINALFYTRGHRSAYDAWAAEGAKGWGYDDLLQYFRRSEQAARGLDTRYRGTEGPMRPHRAASVHPAARAFVEAVAERGYPRSADLNGADAEGVAWLELSASSDGVRQSVFDAYLRPVLGRPNLTVTAEALVLGLVMSGNRCAGVRYAVSGQTREARTDEVIVSAGAFGSPQLLMLSGIGPADALRSHGIQPVTDLPGVGTNLSDHPFGPLVYSAAQPMAEGSGPGNHVDALAALRTDPALPGPDLHVGLVDIPLVPPSNGDGSWGLVPGTEGFTIGYALLTPHSRGTVTLASADPRTPPVIDPALLDDERDAATMLKGLQIARDIATASALLPWRKAELLPGATVTGTRQLRANGGIASYFHPAGTCKMGTEPDAVTDLELRVHGIEGLRVVDASIMPTLPAANPNAPILAIAERAAELIRK